MSDKLIVSWEDYNNTVEKLAIQIEESNYKPTILIGIMRGAAPMIDVLSRIFKLKCAYLAVESYSGKGVEDEQGDIVFSREMSSIAPNMGGRILLCDDLSDTGITFNKSIDWLKKYEPIKGKIEDIKTAVLISSIFPLMGSYFFNQSILLLKVIPVSDKSSHSRILPPILGAIELISLENTISPCSSSTPLPL